MTKKIQQSETVCNGQDGADGESCSSTDNGDGTFTVSCPNSDDVVFGAGVDGEDGADGADGADGESCTATDNEDGTYTINCPNSEPVTITMALTASTASLVQPPTTRMGPIQSLPQFGTVDHWQWR